MAWELKKVGKTDWIQDDSGIYTLINWHHVGVRLDVMTTDDEPVMSFLGKADDVRKAVIQYMSINTGCGGQFRDNNGLPTVSLEHAAYIGAELAKAEILGIKYIQD